MSATIRPRKGSPVVVENAAGKIKIYATGSAYTLSWTAGGERRREKRATLEAARDRAREILADLRSGTAHVRSFTIQQTAAIDQVRARAATRITPTQPLLNPEDREAAAKTFSGFFPPRRGFRIGDTHVRREDGVTGVCTGHYLWTYTDGLKVRAQGRQVTIMHGSTPRHTATLVMLGGTWSAAPAPATTGDRRQQERAVAEAAMAVVQAEDRLAEAMAAVGTDGRL